jgi:hypothetical protein
MDLAPTAPGRHPTPAAVSFVPGSDVLPGNPAEQGPGAASAHIVAIEAAGEHAERRVGRRAEGTVLEQRAGGFEQKARVVLRLSTGILDGALEDEALLGLVPESVDLLNVGCVDLDGAVNISLRICREVQISLGTRRPRCANVPAVLSSR